MRFSEGVSLLTSLLLEPTGDITADLKALTVVAPISSVYIYMCLGLMDTRTSY